MNLNMLWQALNKTVTVTIFNIVCFIAFVAPLLVLVVKCQQDKKPTIPIGNKIETRMLSDSIKIQRLEHEKDSVIIADYQYILRLKQMSKTDLEQEFHKEFSK